MIGPGIGKGRIKSIGFTSAVGRRSGKGLRGGGETVSGTFEEGFFFGVWVFGEGEMVEMPVRYRSRLTKNNKFNCDPTDLGCHHRPRTLLCSSTNHPFPFYSPSSLTLFPYLPFFSLPSYPLSSSFSSSPSLITSDVPKA